MNDRVRKQFVKPSRTKQSFRDECDVNKIMKRFKKAQGVDYLSRYSGYMSGEFGDFSNVVDYRTALDQISRAQDVFMQLPAVVRSKFSNDAAAFLDFVQDEKNADQLVEWGLATKREPEKKAPAEAPKTPE